MMNSHLDKRRGEVDKSISRRASSWVIRSCLWTALIGGLLTGAALLLHARGNPWRTVSMIPGRLPPGDEIGMWIRSRLAASPDGSLLAVCRPDGKCDVWDTEGLQRRFTVPEAPLRDRGPQELICAWGAQFARDGQRLVFRDGLAHSWWSVDRQGHSTRLVDAHSRRGAVDPQSRYFATTDPGEAQLTSLATGKGVKRWPLPRFIPPDARIEWDASGRYLLFAHYTGLAVRDLDQERFTFAYRELDLALPWPMIAHEQSGLRRLSASIGTEDDSWHAGAIATVYGAHFTPDGQHVAVLYGGYHALSRGPADAFHSTASGEPLRPARLRFYATATGRLVKDHELPALPGQIVFSADGSDLYVLLHGKSSDSILTYDVRTLEPRCEISLGPAAPSLWRITPLPDGRHVIALAQRLWLIDLDRRRPPVAISGDRKVAEVAVTNDGRALALHENAGVSMFEPRRDHSRWGAWILPETWAIYVLSVALTLGLVVISGRDAARFWHRPLPGGLWLAGAVWGLLVAGAIAFTAGNYAVGGLYSRSAEQSAWDQVWQWSSIALGFAVLLGIMRRHRGGRAAALVVVIAACALLVGTTILLSVASQPDTVELPWRLNWHGPILVAQRPTVLLVSGAALLVMIAEALLLTRQTVRSFFRETTSDRLRRRSAEPAAEVTTPGLGGLEG